MAQVNLKSVSLEDAEREWRRLRAAREPKLPAGIAGKIAFLSLVLAGGGSPVHPDDLEAIFLDGLAEAPAEIRESVHPEVTVTGVRVREIDLMIQAVLHARLGGRLAGEPEIIVTCTLASADTILSRYEREHPEAAAWIRERAKQAKTVDARPHARP